MKLISLTDLSIVLQSPPIPKHMKIFEDPCFGSLGTVWYFMWLDGLKQYLLQRSQRCRG
jgi:hypothetical protein